MLYSLIIWFGLTLFAGYGAAKLIHYSMGSLSVTTDTFNWLFLLSTITIMFDYLPVLILAFLLAWLQKKDIKNFDLFYNLQGVSYSRKILRRCFIIAILVSLLDFLVANSIIPNGYERLKPKIVEEHIDKIFNPTHSFDREAYRLKNISINFDDVKQSIDGFSYINVKFAATLFHDAIRFMDCKTIHVYVKKKVILLEDCLLVKQRFRPILIRNQIIDREELEKTITHHLDAKGFFDDFPKYV